MVMVENPTKKFKKGELNVKYMVDNYPDVILEMQNEERYVELQLEHESAKQSREGMVNFSAKMLFKKR